MWTFPVSTLGLSQPLRYATIKAQSDLVKAQAESSSGKVADTGLALGSQTATAVSFSRDVDRIQGIIDSNGLLGARLKASQASMQQLGTAAQTFLAAMTAAASAGGAPSAALTSADSMLSSLGSTLNTTYNGEYVFAGINTDVKPFSGFGDGSAARTAFDGAFQSYFGFTQTDAAAQSITADQMNGFLTQVEPQFLGAGWSQTLSKASDTPIVSRISLNETSESSVSINNDGTRKLTMASAIVSGLLGGNIGSVARQAVLEKAMDLAGTATSALTGTQTNMGVIEQRVSAATDRLTAQRGLFEKQVGNLVNVDPYEAATRVSDIMTKLQTSYELTKSIQKFSLMNYL